MTKEASAQIIPFPVDRELFFIRETARQIERRNDELANKYFRTECNRFYGRLQVQGLSQTAIKVEIDRFSKSVQRELQRSAAATSSCGGAA